MYCSQLNNFLFVFNLGTPEVLKCTFDMFFAIFIIYLNFQ